MSSKPKSVFTYGLGPKVVATLPARLRKRTRLRLLPCAGMCGGTTLTKSPLIYLTMVMASPPRALAKRARRQITSPRCGFEREPAEVLWRSSDQHEETLQAQGIQLP